MAFSDILDIWYADNGRSLPWRGINDPYRIWLSEIILQQTRIEQGRDYYRRFVEAFPTVADMAKAGEEQVLRLWQGLGYYSRARNLYATACHIAFECGGRFPDTYEGLLQLKGVGRYTAAAIGSFAFHLPTPVIDGNVYRFISRLEGITTPIGTDAAYNEFESLLLHLIDRSRPDRFNAAMMDFGAMQCKPHPDCSQCPFADRCNALATGRVDMLPVKPPRRQPTDRHFHYFDIRWDEDGHECTLMHPREGNDIWRGLWEFPLIESGHKLGRKALVDMARRFLADEMGISDPAFTISDDHTHQLTHQTIHAIFIRAKIGQKPARMPQKSIIVPVEKIKNIPISRLIDRYLQEL